MLLFEGHASVSADGMIAAADGTMPAGLRSDADWTLFQASLDKAALVVVGRLGHERHPNQGRRRLVPTSSVSTKATEALDPLATLWNPSGLGLDAVLASLGISEGIVAVTGGTRVFDLFVPHYTGFALSEVHNLVLPGGRPTFTSGHPRTVLAAAGLLPELPRPLDPTGRVTLTPWRRPA